MTPGKFTNIPAAAYHESDALSHSKLEVFRRRAALYKKHYIDKSIKRGEESDALKIGRALHSFVLEGVDVYRREFAVAPKCDRRTKEGKAIYADFAAQSAGKTIIGDDDMECVAEMANAIAGNPIAASLLTGGESEVTWRANLSALPVLAQCRTDKFHAAHELSNGRPCVVDLKTVESLDGFRDFERNFWSLGYHRAAGFYMPVIQDCGVTIADWFFVVVEKSEPFGCTVYKPTGRAVSIGCEENIRDILRLAACYKTNSWPSAPSGVQEIDLPSWYEGTAA